MSHVSISPIQIILDKTNHINNLYANKNHIYTHKYRDVIN